MGKSKEWDFGLSQAKLWIDDQSLCWKFALQKGSWKIESLSTITYEASPLTAELHFYTGGTIAKTLRIPKSKKLEVLAKDLIDTVESIKKTSPAGSSQASVADELRKFSELKEQGIITDAEFQAKKKQLLGV